MKTYMYIAAWFLVYVVVVRGLLSDDELRDRVIEQKSARARRACVTGVGGASSIAKAANKFSAILGKRAANTNCVGGGAGGTVSGSAWVDSCLYGSRPTGGIAGGGIGKPFKPINVGKRDLDDFKKPNRDIIFVLDTSGSIPDASFELAKESIAILSRSLCPTDLGSDTREGTKQISVVLFDSQVTTNIPFEESKRGIDHMVKRIMGLRHRRGGTATAHALQHVLKRVIRGEGSRLYNNDTSSHVFVITDGRCNMACQTLAKDSDAIRKAGPVGVQLFALGIGNARACELEIITGKGQDMAFEIGDFSKFREFTLAIKKMGDDSPNKCV